MHTLGTARRPRAYRAPGGRRIADASPQPDAGHAPLPALRTRLDAGDAFTRLDRASRAGKLPGFVSLNGRAFRVEAFGQPFDGELLGEFVPGETNHRVVFRLRTLPRLPLIFAAAIAFAIWPGVVLTDKLIPGEWGWWPTWWWYLPLTIVPLVFAVPKLWKGSQAALRRHALEQIARIEKTIEAERE